LVGLVRLVGFISGVTQHGSVVYAGDMWHHGHTVGPQSREQRAESREQRAESREQRAESRGLLSMAPL
jgi:hypothetical protein